MHASYFAYFKRFPDLKWHMSEPASLEEVGIRGHKSGLLCKVRQRDREAGRDGVLLGQRDSPAVFELAEQVLWQPSRSVPAHRASSGSLSHSNTLIWCWVLLPCHLGAGFCQRHSGPWENEDVRTCSCPKEYKSWMRNKLHVVCLFFFPTETFLCMLCMLFSPNQKPLTTQNKPDVVSVQHKGTADYRAHFLPNTYF